MCVCVRRETLREFVCECISICCTAKPFGRLHFISDNQLHTHSARRTPLRAKRKPLHTLRLCRIGPAKGIGRATASHLRRAVMGQSPQSAVHSQGEKLGRGLTMNSACAAAACYMRLLPLATCRCWHCNLPCGILSGAPRRVYNGNLNNVPKYADFALFTLCLCLSRSRRRSRCLSQLRRSSSAN